MNISFNLIKGEIIGWDINQQPMLEVDAFQASAIMQTPQDYFIYADGEGSFIVYHDPKPGMYYKRENRSWVVDEQMLAFHRNMAWNNVKIYRDQRLRSGVVSGGHTFHTDDRSLTLYTNMRLRAEKLLTLGTKGNQVLTRRNGNPIMWKTMDVVGDAPTFVPMTIDRVIALTDDISDIESERYEIAEAHRMAIEVCDDPIAYDYTTNWV